MTSLLYALGLDGEQILDTFYNEVTYTRTKDGWRVPFDAHRMRGIKATNDLIDADSGEVVLEAGRKFTVRSARQAEEKGLKALKVIDEDLYGHYLAQRHGQSGDRRDLRRGRRRAEREAARFAGRARQ